MKLTIEHLKETERYQLALGESCYNDCDNCSAQKFCNIDEGSTQKDDCIAEIYKTMRIRDMFTDNNFTPEEVNKITEEYIILRGIYEK